MKDLSLRIRVFLFFCLSALGGVAVVLGALWLGYRQLGEPDAFSAFVTAAIAAGFGLVALAVFIWLLFDENVAKPIEALAASLRVGAQADIGAAIDRSAARYLGDLAPAAAAVHRKLSESSRTAEETVAERTARLEREKQQLLKILSDIPTAVIVARADHRIVLYDGQAAALLEGEAPPRLNASIFEYLDQNAIKEALHTLDAENRARMPVVLAGLSGQTYTGHIRKFGAQDGYTLMLEPMDPDAERPLCYDFDLLDRAVSNDLKQTKLRDLTFVVFDSETTGLRPETDRVVQLGALRIVNCKPIPGEVFDTLVNPSVPIPPASTKVHHINDEMVADAPDFVQVCKNFHVFTRDAVMVAHNAPFDMAFLHQTGRAHGLAFDHPVLDTVLLSAVVFGGSATHTLDALCERLNVTIADEKRHTAMGDAEATAAVLVRMITILEARGIETFGQILTEMRKHSRLLEDQNKDT
jgi:DNA polymerase III subunit epsilon